MSAPSPTTRRLRGSIDDKIRTQFSRSASYTMLLDSVRGPTSFAAFACSNILFSQRAASDRLVERIEKLVYSPRLPLEIAVWAVHGEPVRAERRL